MTQCISRVTSKYLTMDNLTALFIGVGLGALFVLVLKKDKEDDQPKVDELAAKIDKSTDELEKAVTDNTVS